MRKSLKSLPPGVAANPSILHPSGPTNMDEAAEAGEGAGLQQPVVQMIWVMNKDAPGCSDASFAIFLTSK